MGRYRVTHEWFIGDGSHDDWTIRARDGGESIVVLFDDNGVSLSEQEAIDLEWALRCARSVLFTDENQE